MRVIRNWLHDIACKARERDSKPRPFKNLPRTTTIVIAGLCLISFLYYNENSSELIWERKHFQERWFHGSNAADHFLVYTNTCKIPNLSPFDKSILKFVRAKKDKEKCAAPLATLYNYTYLKHSDGVICCYLPVHRTTQSLEKFDRFADSAVTLGPKCVPFNNGTAKLSHTFVQVGCRKKAKGSKFDWVENFAAMIPPSRLSNTTAKKFNYWKKIPAQNKPPNIIIIGVDTVSRLHLMRSMPLVRMMLKSSGYHELRGYTKVGENTLPNILGSIAGLSPTEFKPWCPTKEKTFDNCPMLWKTFSELGYVTALAEDYPSIAIFNYLKVGFIKQPTDYYLRPLMIAERLRKVQNDCMGGGFPSTRFLMKYTEELLNVTLQDGVPLFLLSWFTSVSHQEFSRLKNYENDFLEFLRNISRVGDDNSIIFFISDHGYRNGPFRETVLGFFEESLPFFYVRLPETLRRRQPLWEDALRINENYLTTPYDVYATLVEIFKYSVSLTEPWLENRNLTEKSFNVHGSSLLATVQSNRTCENVNIPVKYCRCNVNPTVYENVILMSLVEAAIIKSVNSYINQNHKCQTIHPDEILYFRLVNSSSEHFSQYLMAVKVKEGSAKFEAMVKHWTTTNEIKVMGTVSRINSYVGHSECVDNAWLKNYCVCKRKAKVRS